MRKDFFEAGKPIQIADLNIGPIAKLALYFAHEQARLTEVEKAKRIAAERKANIDDLTGLLRQNSFVEACQSPKVSQDRIVRGAESNCMLMIDVDDFKSINDTYGHDGGDAVLKEIAKRMSSTVREDDILGRWGGDEFIALLPETTEEGGLTLAEKLVENISSTPIVFENPEGGISETTVTLSIGAALMPSHDFELGKHQADLALYQAKQLGKNAAAFHVVAEQQLPPEA